jgi:hypothetical protein
MGLKHRILEGGDIMDYLQKHDELINEKDISGMV